MNAAGPRPSANNSRHNNQNQKEEGARINEEITAPNVRLVGDNIPEQGIYSFADAMKLAEELEIPVITFSSASGTGLTELKDMLWEELNKEQNQVIEISHAPIEVKLIEHDEEIEDEDDEPHTIYLNEVEEEWDLDKYRGIGWDTQDE